MENRRAIHYHRNTISPAAPSVAELAKRRGRGIGEHGKKTTPADRSPKVCATLQCVWCLKRFDHYLVVCTLCGCCQFCGLVGGDLAGCHLCNNALPPESSEILAPRVIRFG